MLKSTLAAARRKQEASTSFQTISASSKQCKLLFGVFLDSKRLSGAIWTANSFSGKVWTAGVTCGEAWTATTQPPKAS
ncbi:hypothetical protein MA16_Dca010512 [Dendrobium catenatum]|uniref:Uncharacterized protein n=1 Tax=Dendrobium catenatum TaxID=906689 RepID=A0A2I0XEY3_9ASPA|nr:hypothetical protein MA16_Dca010512 [Dendrobium catenatum]